VGAVDVEEEWAVRMGRLRGRGEGLDMSRSLYAFPFALKLLLILLFKGVIPRASHR